MSKVHCGSAFELGASRLPYYCTSICVHSWYNWRATWVDSKTKQNKTNDRRKHPRAGGLHYNDDQSQQYPKVRLPYPPVAIFSVCFSCFFGTWTLWSDSFPFIRLVFGTDLAIKSQRWSRAFAWMCITRRVSQSQSRWALLGGHQVVWCLTYPGTRRWRSFRLHIVTTKIQEMCFSPNFSPIFRLAAAES